MSKCVLSSNQIVNLFFHLAFTNPLSTAGKIYRSAIDADGELNNSHSIIIETIRPGSRMWNLGISLCMISAVLMGTLYTIDLETQEERAVGWVC